MKNYFTALTYTNENNIYTKFTDKYSQFSSEKYAATIRATNATAAL